MAYSVDLPERPSATRRLRVGAALFVALLLPAAAPAPEKPNIVLILADDVGQEALGCYGGESYRTPHLDALAASGIRFRHGYSQPVCHPTRVNLLTGRYPLRLGNPKWGSFPKEEEPNTFAHALKRAGYATAVAGKWQLALLGRDLDHPRRLGFDEYSLFGWHEGPRYWRPLIWQNGKKRDDVADRYGPEVYCDFLIDFIRRNKAKPFMAFYSMALCHDVTDDLKEHVPFGPGKDRYDDFKEMVEAMDREVGRLVGALDRMGLREKTLILFTGDNGSPTRSIAGVRDGKLTREPVVSKRRGADVPGGKGSMTDGGTRVPLLASWKGAVKPGQVVDDLVDMSDYFPTFLELAGAKPPDGVRLDGRSFAPRLRGEEGKGRPWVSAERRGGRWVRTQRWKLYDDGRLFDLKADPMEKRPMAAHNRLAKAVPLLKDALRSLR